MSEEHDKLEFIVQNRELKSEWDVRKFLSEKMQGASPELRAWLHRETAKEHVRHSRPITP